MRHIYLATLHVCLNCMPDEEPAQQCPPVDMNYRGNDRKSNENISEGLVSAIEMREDDHLRARSFRLKLLTFAFEVIRPLSDLFNWLIVLSQAVSWRLIAVIMLMYGINQGCASSLQDISTSYYWKDYQLLQPDSTQAYNALSKVPWDLKPIYGIITDAFPINGLRRRPYLAILAIAGMLSWAALATLVPPGSPLLATLVLGLVSLSTAFPDVVVDAVVAQETRSHPSFAGDLQSLSWGSYSVGGLLGYSISGPLVAYLAPKGTFLVLSVTFGAILAASFLLKEEKVPQRPFSAQLSSVGLHFRTFLKTIRDKAIWRPALYIFLARGGTCPDIAKGLFFWYTNESQGPGFSTEYLGFVFAMGYVGSLIGVALYNRYFKQTSYRKILYWAQVMMFSAGFLDLILVTRLNRAVGIPDSVFGVGDKAASNAVARFQLLPILVLAAKLCPPGIEGTLFAFLMSVSNFGSNVGDWLGAGMLRLLRISKDDFSLLWLAVLVRTCFRLSPILFLFLVPEGNCETAVAPEVDSSFKEGEGESELEGESVPLRAAIELGEVSVRLDTDL